MESHCKVNTRYQEVKHLLKTIAEKSRNDFPLFNKNQNNLIYLDHAATSQKPQEVLDSLTKYYSFQNASKWNFIEKLIQNIKKWKI